MGVPDRHCAPSDLPIPRDWGDVAGGRKINQKSPCQPPELWATLISPEQDVRVLPACQGPPPRQHGARRGEPGRVCRARERRLHGVWRRFVGPGALHGVDLERGPAPLERPGPSRMEGPGASRFSPVKSARVCPQRPRVRIFQHRDQLSLSSFKGWTPACRAGRWGSIPHESAISPLGVP